MMLSVKEAKSLEEIKGLERAWNELFENSKQANLFLSFDWIVSWFECSLSSKPYILSAWDNGKLVGIAPLSFEGSVLSFAAQQYSNHLDFVARKGMEQAVAEALAGKIMESSEWGSIKLKHVVDSPILLGVMEQIAAEKGFVMQTGEGEASNVMELPSTLDEYFASYLKRDLKRRWKKMIDLKGASSIEARLLEKREFENGWRSFIEMHLKNISFRKGKSILGERWFQCFYRNAAKRALAKENLFLMSLEVDGKQWGLLLGIRFGKTLSVLNLGYDPSFDETQSIGTVLFIKAIELCLREGIKIYDLLSGGSEYKERLGAKQKSGLQLEVFRSQTDAKVHGLKRKVKDVGKRVLRG